LTYAETYDDSLLVVQQVAGMFQCLEGSLRACLGACLDIIAYFTEFRIRHIPRHENQKVNMLAKQASGYDVGGHNFDIQEQPMYKNFNFSRAGADQSDKPADLVDSADFPSAEAKAAAVG
jgi:hypothetical protein